MTDHALGTIVQRPAGLQRLEGLAWGLFFIWIGVVLLADFGWGIGLLGIGILILGAQVARRKMVGKIEAFWMVVGVCFALCGAWLLLGIQVSLIPIFCIAAGLALLASALLSKPKMA